MPRTTSASLGAQGEAALARALVSLGHRVVESAEGDDADLIVTVDGIAVPVVVMAASVVNPEIVGRGLGAEPDQRGTFARVVVGDLITSAARDALRDAGWGWLDRRGHLVLRANGVHIDADVPTDARSSAGGAWKPISGSAAISWAAALLMSPDDPPSMRGVARRVSVSHSAIVTASKRLNEASLVRADGRPLVPELFWVLADEWRPRQVPLVHLPPVDDEGTLGDLGVALEGSGHGWAVAGTVGAAAAGAPLAIGRDYPPDFYVPSEVELRQATLRLGEASRVEDRACTVAVAPTPLVCAERSDPDTGEWGRWRFAHGLFAALDLAQDRGRGAEILADWQPQDFTRVW